jgi:hypothetical protein
MYIFSALNHSRVRSCFKDKILFFFSNWHWPEPDAFARAIKRCRPKLPDRRPPPWTLPTARRLSVWNTKFQVACATFQIITATMHARVFGITSTARMFTPVLPSRTSCRCRGGSASPPQLPSRSRGLAFRWHEASWIAAAVLPPSSMHPSRFADSERFWRTEQHCRLLFLYSHSSTASLSSSLASYCRTIDHRDDDGDHDNGTPEAANSSASGSATVPAGHAPVHSQPGPCRGAFMAWHDDGSFGSRHGRCRRGRAARDEILKFLIYPYPKKKYKYRIIQNWSTNFGTSPT